MIILPLLALLPQTAPAQTAPARKAPAPKAAPAAPEKPVDPVKADSTRILYAPSRSLRSATAAAAEGLPATPVTVQFECAVGTDSGAPQRCLPLEGAARPAMTQAEFDKRAAAWQPGSASPAVGAALQRVLFTRIRPTAAAGAPPATMLMLFSETVSTGDIYMPAKAKDSSEQGDIEMDERPDAAVMTAYYPATALRAGVGTRTKATCRVMPDRKLFCRDADLVSADAGVTPEMANEFRNATYQVFDSIRLAPLTKSGDPVVGREIEMRISFVVPN